MTSFLLIVLFSNYSINFGEFDSSIACITAGENIIRDHAVVELHKKKAAYMCLVIQPPKEKTNEQ